MTKQTKKHESNCLVAYGIDIFGDRWTLLILRDMILYGKKRYGDFLDADENIATNILADRLKHLEAEGVILKEQDPENRRSNIYSLTPKGLTLTPVLLEIIQWSGNFISSDRRRKELLKRIRDDRDGLVAEIYARENMPLAK